MESKYKWYIIKISYRCEEDICKLVNEATYFKDVFIPYQRIYNSKFDVKDLREVYLYMYSCDESENILSQVLGLCSNDFEVISDDEVNLKRKKFSKYKWYILKVASNCQEKVRQYILQNSIRIGIDSYFGEVFIPHEELNERELNLKKVAIQKKCFPGYIFLYVDLCDAVLNFITNIPKSLKVYGFLKNGNIPKVISDDEMHSMCNALYSAQETKKLSCGYERGERVKINDGLFQNFIGKVDVINDEEKIINVEVSILGRSTIIALDLAQVEKIEDNYE
ncbi:MAG: transcription termination/antitermination protein NusG [Wolbachia sp.]